MYGRPSIASLLQQLHLLSQIGRGVGWIRSCWQVSDPLNAQSPERWPTWKSSCAVHRREERSPYLAIKKI